MMKRNRMLLLILCMITLFLTPMSYAANYDITWNGKLEHGVNGIGYYIAPGCQYTGTIPDAVQKWMYPGWWNPVSMYQTGYNDSNVDFYQYYETSTNTLAYTQCFDYYGNLIPPTSSGKDSRDWRYGRILINDYLMDKKSWGTRIHVLCHEMGHVFGLKDIDGPTSSLMYRYVSNQTTGVTYDANSAIVQKYP